MGAEIVNFGCRLNVYEAEVLRGQLAHADDLVVINSCAVTNEAVRQARQSVRRLKRERPGAHIVVTGCAAQIAPERFAAMPEVAAVLGNTEKLDPKAWDALLASAWAEPVEALPDAETGLRQAQPRHAKTFVGDIMAVRETAPHLLDGFASQTRAFVEVQNGCDHRCTFCIIPYGRGPSRSVPAGLVVEQVRRLVAAGMREVVLTGVDLTSYGPDLPGRPTLGSLVRRILTLVPALERLRLSSLDSIEADPLLVDLIVHEPRIMPHLHLSLQAGDDMILKRMKRRHGRDDAIRFVAEVKDARPEVAIGADIIAGFPTETDAMFENSLRLIGECDIVYGHIFPYSPREGTPAARMPQVPGDVRRARAAALRKAAGARKSAYFSRLKDSVQQVLVERPGMQGHGESYAPVELDFAAEPGSIVAARVTGASSSGLLASAA